jgi:DNA-binding IclR family transcriptional regulator
VSSVATALLVLEAVSERQPVGVSDLARRLKIPKTSAQRALGALADARWIEATKEGRSTRWVLTPTALVVGSRVGGQRDLPGAARPVMRRLHSELEETVHLAVPDGDHMVLIEHLESNRVVRSSYPLGMRFPMSASSSGKAYLAALEPSAAEKAIPDSLPAPTPSSITDRATLRAQLEQIRAAGYATNRGELSPEICAVGAAIRDSFAAPIAAISVSVPLSRMTDDSWATMGPMVAAGAEEIGAALHHPGSG